MQKIKVFFFLSEKLLKRYYAQPLTEKNDVNIMWDIPVTYYKYRVPALEWIYSMIDFPGPGGLKDILVNEDLATGVGASEGNLQQKTFFLKNCLRCRKKFQIKLPFLAAIYM